MERNGRNLMSKLPYVERPAGYESAGLTGECAYLWTVFLANEADMDNDPVAYDKFKTFAEQLAPKEGKPIPVAVYYADIEDAISKYKRGSVHD
jgi:hypothetical protein